MFQKSATHFIELTLVTFSCFGFPFHAPAQSPPSNAPNPPTAKNEPRTAPGDVVIHLNQVAYDLAAPKFAVLETSKQIPASNRFLVKDAQTLETVFEGALPRDQECNEWFPGRYFYRLDFSSVQRSGHFKVQVDQNGNQYDSVEFEIGKNALATRTVPAIIQ